MAVSTNALFPLLVGTFGRTVPRNFINRACMNAATPAAALEAVRSFAPATGFTLHTSLGGDFRSTEVAPALPAASAGGGDASFFTWTPGAGQWPSTVSHFNAYKYLTDVPQVCTHTDVSWTREMVLFVNCPIVDLILRTQFPLLLFVKRAPRSFDLLCFFLFFSKPKRVRWLPVQVHDDSSYHRQAAADALPIARDSPSIRRILGDTSDPLCVFVLCLHFPSMRGVFVLFMSGMLQLFFTCVSSFEAFCSRLCLYFYFSFSFFN